MESFTASLFLLLQVTKAQTIKTGIKIFFIATG